MNKPPPEWNVSFKLTSAGSATLRKLVATGAAASEASHSSFVIKFSTTPMDKLPPEGISSLIILSDCLPEF